MTGRAMFSSVISWSSQRLYNPVVRVGHVIIYFAWLDSMNGRDHDLVLLVRCSDPLTHTNNGNKCFQRRNKIFWVCLCMKTRPHYLPISVISNIPYMNLNRRESAQHFWLGKTITIFWCAPPLTGFEPLVIGSRVRRCTNWATPRPITTT